MKALIVLLLSAILIVVSALPFEESNKIEEPSENGWFVPQIDGSLQWMDKEEAAKAERLIKLKSRTSDKPYVKYYLYTQEDPDKPQQIFLDDPIGLRKSNFNANNPTRFIIHGWQNGYTSPVNVVIRSAFLEVMECNVISVDWSQKSKSKSYIYSKTSVPEVGKEVAKMIDYLSNEGNMSLDDLKVIGHSLGAHVSGFAGKHVTTGKIHTIIGLDPAWPLYNAVRRERRLCQSDAHYVEAIHTNGGILGFLHPIGKADFYPNGGMSQPGCGLDIGGVCSHSRSFEYYAESIKQNSFKSHQCQKWLDAADATSTDCKKNQWSTSHLGDKDNYINAKGYYYTPVRRRSPYGFGSQ